MAKITITIEDIPGGKVKVVSTPSFETMAKMIQSGEDMSDAHGYALKCINTIREVSKSANPSNIIQIPKVRLI